MPRHRPSVPTTPASSSTSRTAVHAGSSSGSTPPPGTIQLSGLRDEVTSSTYRYYNDGINGEFIRRYEVIWFSVTWLTSFSSVDLTHIQAALCRNPSLSYIRVEFGFSLTILCWFVGVWQNQDEVVILIWTDMAETWMFLWAYDYLLRFPLHKQVIIIRYNHRSHK